MTAGPRKRQKTEESENLTESENATVAQAGQLDVVTALEKLTEQIGLIAEKRKLDTVMTRCVYWRKIRIELNTGIIVSVYRIATGGFDSQYVAK